jgi:non-ribosomal peptide synthetase component F
MVDQFSFELAGLVTNLDSLAQQSSIDLYNHPHLFAIDNVSPKLYSGNASLLHQLFEECATESPTSVALEWVYDISQDGTVSSHTWTFDELNASANRLAHYILEELLDSKASVPDSVIIPLCLEKSPLLYISMIAVMKTGCAYLPIDPQLPLERKLFMISDSDAKFILTTRDSQLTKEDFTSILVDSDDTFKAYPTSNPICRISSENLAYILSTSGTSGKPKSVMINVSSDEHSIFVCFTFYVNTELKFSITISFKVCCRSRIP